MKHPCPPLAALALFLSSGPVVATECIVIDQVPAVITTAGSYCLASDLVSAGAGVRVEASNVVLDCGGFALNGLGQSSGTTSAGVTIAGASNVSLKRCLVKGFAEGIRAFGDGLALEGNTIVAPFANGMIVQGENVVVEGNRVMDVGGTTVPNWGTFGILLQGSGVVRDNIISGVAASDGTGRTAYGLYAVDSDASQISGNIIRNVISDGSAIAMTLTIAGSDNAVIRGNSLANAAGIHSFGVFCSGQGNTVVENVMLGFTYGLSESCVAAGNYGEEP